MRKLIKFMIIIVGVSIVFIGCNANKTKEESDEIVASVNQKQTTNEGFKIYDVDINTYEMVKPYDFFVNSNESLDKKVKLIVDEIMNKWFRGLEYTVLLEKRSGKDIVVINLIEEGGPDTPSGWYSQFQGSTRARVNSKRIVNNILQKEYKGEWIDGVEILYNGVESLFQHVPELTGVKYSEI